MNAKRAARKRAIAEETAAAQMQAARPFNVQISEAVGEAIEVIQKDLFTPKPAKRKIKLLKRSSLGG